MLRRLHSLATSALLALAVPCGGSESPSGLPAALPTTVQTHTNVAPSGTVVTTI